MFSNRKMIEYKINLFDLNGCELLEKKGYKVENLIDFPGH